MTRAEPGPIRRAMIAFCTRIGRATFTGWVERGRRVGVAGGLAAGAHRPVDGGGHSRVPLAGERPDGQPPGGEVIDGADPA